MFKERSSSHCLIVAVLFVIVAGCTRSGDFSSSSTAVATGSKNGVTKSQVLTSQGPQIYIAQSTQGADTGADCADAHSAAWFNTNATGGNTYHLCGTFTGAAGSTMLTVPTGTSTAALTVVFEPGAVMTAPYWGGQYAGAISIPSRSYVKIDGGANGIIQNTANGDGKTYQQMSQGIYVQNGSSNIEISNLTIQHIYDSVPGGTGNNNAVNTADILVSSGSIQNIFIHDNVLTGAFKGVGVDWDGGVASNVNIYNNSISDHTWGVEVGSWVASGSTSNINIYGNTITGWSNWDSTTNDFYHTDGVIVWGHQGFPSNVSIYNNTIYGPFKGTALIYCTWDGLAGTGSASLCTMFNNVLVLTSATNEGRAIWTGSNSGPHRVINNTMVGPGSSMSGNLVSVDGTVSLFENNIFYNNAQAIGTYATTLTGNITTSDYNDDFALSGSPFAYNIGNAGQFITYTQWQAAGFDLHGVTGNPMLDVNYQLQSGSAAIGKGANLSNLGIAALNFDKAGIARPTSGAWDIGAYQFSSAPVPTPTPVPVTATPTPTPVPTATPLPVSPPSTTITFPANGATVSRHTTVNIQAVASDNVGVTSVAFYVNNTLVCTDAGANLAGTQTTYTCNWSVPGQRNRTYSLQTKAYNAAGLAGVSAMVTVTSM